jgi:hypothetical protein
LIVHDEKATPKEAKSRTAFARIAKRRSLPTIHKLDAARIDVCFFVRIERCYAFDAVAGVLEYRSMPRQSGVRRCRCSQQNVQKFPDMRDEQTATLLDYYTSHQASTQWRAFLTALAQEFETQLETAQLRELMARIGVRFADAHPAGACATLDDLASFFNTTWSSLDWGFVNLVEQDDYLAIEHFCAPLAAFGTAAATWTPAFLEGAYQRWLDELGAGGLDLRQVETGERHAFEFRLAKTA